MSSPQPNQGRPRRRLRRSIQIVGLSIVVLLLVSIQAWLAAIGRWLVYPSTSQPVDVIAVYGGGQERTRYGAYLYQHGIAPELWHTGYAERRAATVAFLVKQDVPPNVLYYLPSNSTWEDGAAIISFAKQRHIRRILVVTSWYHSRRSMCTIKKQLAGSGIEAYYDVPPSKVGSPTDWWRYASSRRQVLSELAKMVYYTLRYGMISWNC